jgi:hypothetical protein
MSPIGSRANAGTAGADRQQDDEMATRSMRRRVAIFSPWVRFPGAIILGMLVFAIPLLSRFTPDWSFYPLTLLSSLLVWFGFVSAIEIWRPYLEFFERALLAFFLYLASGVVFEVSVVLGAWPNFGAASLDFAPLAVFIWPGVMVWVLFISLSWYPAS